MKKKVQLALGRHLKEGPSLDALDDIALGDRVLAAAKKWLSFQIRAHSGAEMTATIVSANLRIAADLAARNARRLYLLGKLMMLRGAARRGVVRSQVFEYGSVAEAILVDLIQCVGKQNMPPGIRPAGDKNGTKIDWNHEGLFKVQGNNSKRLRHWTPFKWLIDTAETMEAIDAPLARRLHALRETRNLVHSAIPDTARFKDAVDAGKEAMAAAKELRNQVLAFKQDHGLPLP